LNGNSQQEKDEVVTAEELLAEETMPEAGDGETVTPDDAQVSEAETVAEEGQAKEEEVSLDNSLSG